MISPSPTATPVRPSPTATATATGEPPEVTPSPVVERPVIPTVAISETTITLPTYPFSDYLIEQVDSVYNMPVFYFNRPSYEAAARAPTLVDYTGIVLENPYLRLTFLPELGGRLYSAVVKATGQEIFYQNQVVKPSRYGGLQPPEANWWLATGGMEWAYPTQEHGYRFGVAWDYQVSQDEQGATITLSDTAPGRVGLRVEVTLPVDKAQFQVKPVLVNDGEKAVPVQLWLNAALTLTPGSMSSHTRFVIPTEAVTIHSRGEEGWVLPAERQLATWPEVNGVDLQDYNQWTDYLGFFIPNREIDFMGAYNPVTQLGVVRLVVSSPPSGSGKIFAFGRNFPDRSYTDDDSQYFEIWGGANTGFWPEHDLPLAPGETLTWEEIWWPLAGLEGLTWSNQTVAFHLQQDNGLSRLSALVAQPAEGRLRALSNGQTLLDDRWAASPDEPLQWELPAAAGPVTIQFLDHQGQVLLDYLSN